jgi:hypothetical protein
MYYMFHNGLKKFIPRKYRVYWINY